MLVVTSPTTTTVDDVFCASRTSTWGSLALPRSRFETSAATWAVVWPATAIRPTNGTEMDPSLSTIWGGSVVAELGLVERGSSVEAPNSAAGGASQITSSTWSPAPITGDAGPWLPKASAKLRRWR
jgi:hypothetical protein